MNLKTKLTKAHISRVYTINLHENDPARVRRGCERTYYIIYGTLQKIIRLCKERGLEDYGVT